MAFKLTYKPYGERAVLIEWPAIIDENILNDIIIFKKVIEKKNIEFIVELKSAYNSLLIIYDSFCRNFENEVILLKKLYKRLDSKTVNVSRLWHIPVCYDAVFGIDLGFISIEKNISKEVVVKKHSEAVYTVYFIGFLPGFLYLGGLDSALHTPRKSSPRLKIEKGAVAIGGQQTGVYPSESPGGWNVIGNSPIEFFNPESKSPCFAEAGDKIKFYPITLNEYKSIKILSDAGVYQLESEVIYG